MADFTFGIHNFRSFDAEGIMLDRIEKVNLFIGKNNSGKSNVLKFLFHLNERITGKSSFPTDITSQYKRNGLPTAITIKISPFELGIPLSFPVSNSYAHSNNSIKYSDCLPEFLLFKYECNSGDVEMDKALMKMRNEGHNHLSNVFQYPQTTTEIRDATKSYFKKVITDLVKDCFKSVIYIPDLRFVSEGNVAASSNTTLNGANIISELFKMKSPKIGEESKKDEFDRIVSTIKDLLNIEDLELNIPHDKQEIILNSYGNKLPLRNYGSGIHELILLTCGLLLHPKAVVCLEEPELHLHPELQKKFFQLLLKTENTYFISTHSNSFLDISKKDVAIYHVSHDTNKSTINYCPTNKETTNALNDLGYKASDILQSNGIIWVEGPSDRIYLKKWISLLNSKYQEGIDYSIMFYGGRLLSTVSYDSDYFEEELIPLLKINKNAFVVIDSDITPNKTSINKTKERIQNEIGEANCWITQGKEIENYLTCSTINGWLKSIGHSGNLDENDLGKSTILGDVLKEHKVKVDYSGSKHKYSKEISNFITEMNFGTGDSKKKIQAIVGVIEKWNS